MSHIILDVDAADRDVRTKLADARTEGLWGYKLGDEVLRHGITTVLYAFAKRHKVMIDLKHEDVPGRLARIVKLYAAMDGLAPKFLTVSGDSSIDALRAAIAERRSVDIIMTTVLSDVHHIDLDHDAFGDLMEKVCTVAPQGITCPAWLLPELDLKGRWQGHIIATGVVSEGVEPRHHFNPQTLEYALEKGATHVVVGTEVVSSIDPVKTLANLALRCQIATVPAY